MKKKTASHFLRSSTLFLLLLLPHSSLAQGNEAPTATRVSARSDNFYNGEIGKNRTGAPRNRGETDTEYAVRTSHLAAELSPKAPPESSGPNGGTVDLADKLHDASLLAQEGSTAASVQAGEMVVALANGITDSLSPNASGRSAGNLTAVANAMRKYGQIWNDMKRARDLNEAGKVYLKANPGRSAGSSATRTQALSEQLVTALSPAARQILEDRGLSPERVLDRLLSGEVDTSDPAAVLGELGDKRELTSDSLSEAREIVLTALNAPLGTESRESRSGPAEAQDGYAGRASSVRERRDSAPPLGRIQGHSRHAARTATVSLAEPMVLPPQVDADLHFGAATGRSETTPCGLGQIRQLEQNGVKVLRYSHIFSLASAGYRRFGRRRPANVIRLANYPW